MRHRKFQVCFAVVGAVLGFAACGGQADIADGAEDGALIGTSEDGLGPSLPGEIARSCIVVCQKACPPSGAQAGSAPGTLPIEDVRVCANACVASGGQVCLAEYRDLLQCFGMQPASDLTCFDNTFPILETSACDQQSDAYLECLFGSF